MNPKLQMIFDRRSVRKYTADKLSDQVVADLLEAAMAAPSACCKDPWHFVVVRDRARLAQLAEGLPNGKMLADAAAGFIVCGSLHEAHANSESFLLQDCGAAIENLLLAASALGLGAVWLGIQPRPERAAHVAQVLGIPDGMIVVSAIAVGVPAERPPARTRYNAAKVHDERW
jgi:nitroreductase